jgi:hypothetical protein
MDVLLTMREKKDQESEAASISISTMLQSLLVRTQEIGDQKLGVVQQIQDMLENKTAQLDIDQKNSGMSKFLYSSARYLVTNPIFMCVSFKLKTSSILQLMTF